MTHELTTTGTEYKDAGKAVAGVANLIGTDVTFSEVAGHWKYNQQIFYGFW
jgi:hypothetical protein